MAKVNMNYEEYSTMIRQMEFNKGLIEQMAKEISNLKSLLCLVILSNDNLLKIPQEIFSKHMRDIDSGFGGFAITTTFDAEDMGVVYQVIPDNTVPNINI